MHPNLSIRPVETGDRDFLFLLFASARETELANLEWDDAQRKVFLEMQFAAQQTHYATHFPHRKHHLILFNSQPVGMIDTADESDEIRVLDIILRPEKRNSGIGTSLMKNLLEESERSAKPVRLYVEKFNRALSLYRRLGFRILDDTGVHYHMERTPERQECIDKAETTPKLTERILK